MFAFCSLVDQVQVLVLALPSPTVFGRSRRSDEAKIGPSPEPEVIDESKFPHNTGKIGSPKNKLPLPAPTRRVRVPGVSLIKSK